MSTKGLIKLKINSPKKKHKRKCHKNRRISRKIKFIRHSCSNSKQEKNKITQKLPVLFESNNSQSEKKYILVFTMINLVHSFLRESSFPEKNNKDFRKNFISIINNLSMNENEFIIWTLLIENNYNKIILNNKIEFEPLFYLGIIAKEKINPDYSIQINPNLNKEKFEDLNINLKELNTKLNHYKSLFTSGDKKYKIDYEKMINDINDINKERKKQNQQNANIDQNQINNMDNFEREESEENNNGFNNYQESNSFYRAPVFGLSHDSDELAQDEYFNDCYKNIKMNNFFLNQ